MPYKDKNKQKSFQHLWHQKNKGRRVPLMKKRLKDAREVNRKIIQVIKKNVPCKDCGINYHPYVMDFDHISTDKVSNIAAMVARRNKIEDILDEISKCELVCANCHRMRTLKRREEES